MARRRVEKVTANGELSAIAGNGNVGTPINAR